MDADTDTGDCVSTVGEHRALLRLGLGPRDAFFPSQLFRFSRMPRTRHRAMPIMWRADFAALGRRKGMASTSADVNKNPWKTLVVLEGLAKHYLTRRDCKSLLLFGPAESRADSICRQEVVCLGTEAP